MKEHSNMTKKLTLTTHSAEETQAFAEALGRILKGGEVLALEGDLGAGKTCFVQGLAAGLEVPPEVYVCSPTYTLHDSYPGRKTLHHLDLYRLGDADELEEIGWRDYLDGEAIVVIEWANRIEDYLPPDFLLIRLEILDAHRRTIHLDVNGDDLSHLERWFAQYQPA